MRTFKHWTPRYLWNRVNEKLYRRRHPDLPWLTPTAISILTTCLLKSDTGLEFGSGRSTLWFAQRTEYLTSVEHDPAWHARTLMQLDEKRLQNVNYWLREREPDDGHEGLTSGYVKVTDTLALDSIDYVLIDGLYRSACACCSIDKLKAGGMLIIDNANLYLPCLSHSPNSRNLKDGPASELWSEFLKQVKNWRFIWTSNGISDTAIYFKP
jgi:predicted O-methyltransferase YrrM